VSLSYPVSPTLLVHDFTPRILGPETHQSMTQSWIITRHFVPRTHPGSRGTIRPHKWNRHPMSWGSTSGVRRRFADCSPRTVIHGSTCRGTRPLTRDSDGFEQRRKEGQLTWGECSNDKRGRGPQGRSCAMFSSSRAMRRIRLRRFRRSIQQMRQRRATTGGLNLRPSWVRFAGGLAVSPGSWISGLLQTTRSRSSQLIAPYWLATNPGSLSRQSRTT
jgi:hypothetical protein